MKPQLRQATSDDIPDLACLLMLATHGLTDALFHDVIPGLPTNEIVERRFRRTSTTASYVNCWVAVDRTKVIGQIHTFPFDDAAKDPPDGLIPKERRNLLEPLNNLDAAGQNTY